MSFTTRRPKSGFSSGLNWNHAENCNPNPQPEPGVCTFMGTSASHLSGKGKQHWTDRKPYLIKTAIDIMRKQGGYRCELPPKGWKKDESSIDDNNSKVLEGDDDQQNNNEEFQYIKSHYGTFKVLGKKTDAVIFELEHWYGWIFIRCNTREAANFVHDHISDSPHYELGVVEHTEERKTVYSSSAHAGTSLVIRTGGGSCSSVGTMFELQRGSNKTVAKALCAYRNMEMQNPGPTIELFEVAGECRRKGFGTLLLDEMASHFRDMFFLDKIGDEKELDMTIKFNVCHCTNWDACEWFLSQGFEDWSGIGEELGKYLY